MNIVVYLLRYLAARILQPEMVAFQIRPFPGWPLTLSDFNCLSEVEQDKLTAEYESLPEDERLTLRLKAIDRTRMEFSEMANPGDLVYMVRETTVPTVQIIPGTRGQDNETIVSWFARTNRFQLLARLKQYYLVESVSRAIDYRLNFMK